MVTVNCLLPKRLITCAAIILVLAVSVVSAATEESATQANPDSIMDGFVALVEGLDDMTATIVEVTGAGSNSFPLSGRIMYSKSHNMLAFTLMNSLLDGMTLMLDNNAQAVYLLTPSSGEAIKMTADVAAAQLVMLGIGSGHSGSIMAVFEQFLPVSILSNFALEPVGLTQSAGKQYFLIKATPKDPGPDDPNRGSYSIIWIDPETYYPSRLEQYSGDKSMGAFVLTDSSLNSGLDKDDFMALLIGKSIVNY